MLRKSGRGAAVVGKDPRPERGPHGRLAEYNRKRDFELTPEPAGTAVARVAGRPLEFVVQKPGQGAIGSRQEEAT